MPRLLRFILKRLLMTLLILFAVSIIAFALIRIAPGNPAMMVLPDGASQEAIKAMEVKLGLDQPMVVQYFRYIGGVLKGDLGTSIIYKLPVKDLIFQRLPATFKLTIITMLVCLLISIPLGIVAGSRQGTIVDFLATMFALLGQSMSTVWMGILVIYIFAVKLKWFPAMGYGTWKNFILPAMTLGYPVAAQVTRMGRSGIIDVLKEDYITATYAKGISRAVVYTKYAFKNALIPIVTIVGMQIGIYLAGAVVVETIFAWPGFGQLIFQAVGTRDYPLVQSCLLVSAALFAIVNMLVDIVNSFIDPRITLQ
ncbi:MAG: ABC transporter permease [Clostridiales bacterium]|nr:ABC transporter permease [Clostridiales bacterium]